mmetsp:Transcript_49802/g.144812  ORF Transcript_49802/g.144812 Transcript_49802/m.144812 type:complete len:174 (+) Transcript_49802:78-599(+)
MKLVALCMLSAAVAADGAALMLRKTAALSRAAELGGLAGESEAASLYFRELLSGLPKQVNKEKEAAVIENLEAEVGRLQGNVDKLKTIEKGEKAHQKESDHLKATMQGKDKAMLEKMDEWSHRMNEKAKVGAMDVMSKLKNAIHLIKKGALSGNKDAEAKLGDVLQRMSSMVG